MFRKLPTKQSSKPILASEQLQKLVAELTEQNQETISGGGLTFPCDGPGQGDTCGEFQATRQPEAEGKIRGTLLLGLAG